MALIELEKDDSIQVSSMISEYKTPDYVYFPIPKNAQIKVNLNSKVAIGDILIYANNQIFTSSISGTVTGLKKITTPSGPMSALEIKNDFQEIKKLAPTQKLTLSKINKEKLTKLLIQEFNLDLSSKDHLILNTLDDEPYVLTENFYLLLYYEDFLELLDKLAKIYAIKDITLVVKSSNSENINQLLEFIGMYPSINLKIVPNFYLLGRSEFLLNYLDLQADTTTIIKASTFYDLYNLIKRNRQKTDKLITISGDMLTNPQVIRVKIGTPLKSILPNFITLKEGNKSYYANGLMSGTLINPDEFIITSDTDSLIITKNENTKEGTCLNCGMCLEVCPKKLNPLMFKDSKYLTQNHEKCLKCGLCSYICPVHINFNKYLEGGENA